MLEEYFEHRFVLRRLRASPAGPYLDGFAASLCVDRHRRSSMRKFLRAAAHFAEWSRSQGIAVGALDDAALEKFVAHLPKCSCLRRDGRKKSDKNHSIVPGARRFLDYLRVNGVVPDVQDAGEPGPPLLIGFDRWMLHHRGVKEVTLDSYRGLLRQLLDAQGDDPAAYTASGLRRFVLDRANLLRHKSAGKVASATRMFLRYLAAEGRCDANLIAAIPRIAEWPLASLPRYLASETVDRLIASCDMTTPTGIRDRAILLVLARLGLRPADVAHLRLKDVDWEGARLRVFGKGRRESWLPLPQDVGDSFLRYLEEARPDIADDHVFITVQAPIGPFRTATAVGGVVKSAVNRTGVKTRSKGAYILRHSAATEMLRQGASMGQIGVVLRHRSVNTTAIYAKVDIGLLRTMVQPWPGGEVSP